MEDRTEKAVIDVDTNQRHLILAIEELRGTTRSMLLDGHFCLFNREGGISPIPVEVFAAISPVAILVVEVPVEIVRMRLEQRDDRTYDLDLLNELARSEREQAEFVSSSLQIPLRFVGAGAIEEAVTFLKSSSCPLSP